MTIDLPARPRDYWPTTGWREVDPARSGLDPVRLEAAESRLLGDYPHIDSFLVVHGGALVHARHSGDSAPDVLHNLKSATKSVTSMLVGIALDTGDLSGVAATLGDLLPEQFTASSDPQTRAITVRDLLTMRSGLDWAEWRGTTLQMFASNHWLRFILEREQAAEPGTRHNYSTGDSHLLAALLQRATGMNLLDYADLYLFGPLGIERRAWDTDPQGVPIGGSELQLSAGDMAKLGFLMLNGGAWDGDQIISTAWVKASFTPHALNTPAGDGLPRLDYGYQWWLRAQGDYPSAMAVGFGGQFITVIPALDLVIVMTGDLANIPDGFQDNRMIRAFNVVQDDVVPAATGL